MRPFIYNVLINSTLATGNSTIQNLNIGSDSDFKLAEIRTNGTNNVFVSIKEMTGQNWSSNKFNMSLIGSGQNGLKILEDVTFPKNSQLEITIENQTGSNQQNLEVQLIGYKVN